MVNLGMFRTARYRGLQHALLGMFWAAQYQCSWATVTHSATSWPEYHLPGPHNAWLFYFCQVCLAEKRHVWREGWVCSLVSWEKNIALKGNCMSNLNLFYFLPFTEYFQGTRGLWWWSLNVPWGVVWVATSSSYVEDTEQLLESLILSGYFWHIFSYNYRASCPWSHSQMRARRKMQLMNAWPSLIAPL